MPHSILRNRIAARVDNSFMNEARSGARHAMLVRAARAEISASSPLLVDLSASEGIAIRGHDATMKTWTLAEHE